MRDGLEKKCLSEQGHTVCAGADMLDTISKNLRNFVAASKISEKHALPNAHRAWRFFASGGIQRVKAETTAKDIAASPREKNPPKNDQISSSATRPGKRTAFGFRRLPQASGGRRLHVKIPSLAAAV
jgi:hypothetical protein